LSGLGGEIARSFYGNPFTFFFCRTKESIKRYIKSRYVNSWQSLVKSAPLNEVSRYLDQFFDSLLDSGAAVEDLLDLFYTLERVRRWAGSQTRKFSSTRDFVQIFTTRKFITSAFSLSSISRFTEPLHHNMMRELSPVLYGMPFLSEPWRPQLSIPCLLQQTLVKANKSLKRRFLSSRFLNETNNLQKRRDSCHLEIWFEKNRHVILDDLLSTKQSLIWDFVDRDVFERMMRGDLVTHRIKNIEGLYRIWSLYSYFHK